MKDTDAMSAWVGGFWKRRMSRLNVSELIMPAFIVIYAASITAIDHRFLSWDNLDNLASQIAPRFDGDKIPGTWEISLFDRIIRRSQIASGSSRMATVENDSEIDAPRECIECFSQPVIR